MFLCIQIQNLLCGSMSSVATPPGDLNSNGFCICAFCLCACFSSCCGSCTGRLTCLCHFICAAASHQRHQHSSCQKQPKSFTNFLFHTFFSFFFAVLLISFDDVIIKRYLANKNGRIRYVICTNPTFLCPLFSTLLYILMAFSHIFCGKS